MIVKNSDSEVAKPINGKTFKVNDNGKLKLEVWQLFRNMSHFREVILDYSIQEAFRLKRYKNERRITCGCVSVCCFWRVHGSPTCDRVTFQLKTLNNEHNCLAVPKNKDMTSVWIGQKFETLIKENPDMSIRVLAAIVLRQCGVTVPDYTLYRAKKYALNIGYEDHKLSFNKLYRYGHILRERDLRNCVIMSTLRLIPDPNTPARFKLSIDFS
ncbi:hypothetical protein ACOSP7_013186 [Xanthoceras sorbifolium]